MSDTTKPDFPVPDNWDTMTERERDDYVDDLLGGLGVGWKGED